jgi:hypothetical protein
MIWFPLFQAPDSTLLEQALLNPKTSTGLNEWMDARLDVKLKETNDKMDARFAQMDAKMDGRFAQMDAKMDGRFAQMDGKFEQMNIKLDSKTELVELLKETKKGQEEKIYKLEAVISGQNTQLQEMLSVAAVNKMLESQNAELKKRVEQFEQLFFKNQPDA